MKILIVDDSHHIQTQLRLFLNSGGYTDLLFADTALQAFKYLGIESSESACKDIDLILLDIIMPEIDGIVSCYKIKNSPHTRHIPVIMVTGDTTTESLQKAFEAGATDYITKPLKKVELLVRIGAALRLKQEIDARQAREQELLELTTLLEEMNKKLQQSNERLLRMANVDGLTGLANRRYFDEFLAKEWRRALRLSHPISLIMIDIDYFKAYNDTYGHLEGDETLKKVAHTLQLPLKRPLDLAARYGGEEFVVLLPDTDMDGAVNVATLLHAQIHNLRIPHASSQAKDFVTISLGIASCQPAQSSPPETLVDFADKALYDAKMKGRDMLACSNERA